MQHNECAKQTILVTGASGFLGGSIVEALKHRYDIIGVGRSVHDKNSFQCDLTNNVEVAELAELVSPSTIIHAAGLKDIQLCEESPKLAEAVNVHMVGNICQFFPTAKIIYMSTDYVFRGDVGMYGEADTPNPITEYGKTKYQGELVGKKIAGKKFKIIRTASVFSRNSSFIKFLKFRIASDLPVDAYTDCVFSPTYLSDLVTSIEKIIEEECIGDIFHVVGVAISRYSFAKAYFEAGNYDLGRLLKLENKGKNIHLYKDLSLDGLFTANILGLQPTHLKEAFSHIID